MNIGVIILNWNGKKDTLACLTSLQKQTFSKFTTIVVDNGSIDDSTHQIATQFPHVILMKMGKNLGFAEGNNKGIEKALTLNCDAIFLLNNDTELDPECLEKLAAFSNDYPDAIIGCRLCQFDQRNTYDHIGGFWNAARANFDLIGANELTSQEKYPSGMSLDFVCGAALFAKRHLWEKVGFLEPKFFLIWEESDFCHRARHLGYTVRYCHEAIVYHKVSASFVGGKPHSHYFWWRNRLLYIKRNFTKKIYRKLLFSIVLPEILHIFKLYLIKAPLTFFRRKNREQKIKELLLYQAALKGAIDYFLGHFGPPPLSILKK